VLHEQPYFDRFLNYFLPAEKTTAEKEKKDTKDTISPRVEESKS
jgi:hypothetical protein